MVKQLFYFLLFSICISACANKNVSNDKLCTFVLVRHAEKVKNTRDPGLTKEGKDRAYFLAEYLKNEPIHAIYSTDYFRTRKTAQPTVSKSGIEMQIYDSSDLERYATSLRSNHNKGTILVVGHSNTTPILANHLIGKDKYDQLEEWQYDQIYFVTVYRNGDAKAEVKTFGKKSILPAEN